MRHAWLVMVVLGTACSGKSDAITKVDGKKTFDKLSTDDRKQLCTDFTAYSKKHREPTSEQEITCKLTAIMDARRTEGERKDCKESYDECMKKPPPEATDLDCKFLDDLTCDITVDDFTACIREQMASSKAVAAELSCDKLPEGDTTKFAMDILEKMSGGPKCKVLKERCDKPKSEP